MKEVLKQLYSLTDEELDKLLEKYSEEKLMKAKWEFLIGKLSKPITTWEMLYYIEKHGNFLERGKKCHHNIARAIYNSMTAKDKVEMLSEIAEMETGYANYKKEREYPRGVVPTGRVVKRK